VFSAVLIVLMAVSCGSDPTSPGTWVMDVAGVWQGTWQSDVYPTSGSVSAEFTQDGSNISGTIDIPEIGFDDVQLTGTITENSLAFGDINETIQFSGTVAADTASASGSYANPGADDQGTWTMERVSGSGIILADSIAIPFQFMFATDMAFAGSRFWMPGPSSHIYSVGSATGAIDSIVAPGDHLSGITWDGNDLIVADGTMGTGKMFRMDIESPSVLMAPGESAAEGLAFDGTDLWCLDWSAVCIYRMDMDGTVLGSFPCMGDIPQGLAFDGTDLWYSSFSSGSGSTDIYQVDTDGNLISSFEAPSFMSGGLTHDGQSIWYCDGGSDIIYELDHSGAVLSSFGCPDGGRELAWDGTNLWLACTDQVSASWLYCIDTSGNVLDSFEGPGESSCGLAFDGSHLWNADTKTDRIYRLNTDGDNFLQLPPFEFDYLAFDGTLFWADDNGQSQISGFDEDGTVSVTFPYPCDEVGGLEWMDGSLWVFENEMSALSSAYRLNTDGSVIEEYEAMGYLPEPLGMASDGSSLWYLGRSPLSPGNWIYRTVLMD